MDKATGRITGWYPQRGFGFILQMDNNRPINRFFHLKNVSLGMPRLNAEVAFTPIEREKGAAAVDVEVLGSTALGGAQ